VQDVQDNPIGPAVKLRGFGGDPAASQWKLYGLPLRVLGGVNQQIGGIITQDESGKPEPPMYVDAINLQAGVVQGGGSPTPTAVVPAPTKTPSPSPTSVQGNATYPLHTHVISTTFYVGEVIGSCGICSQVRSYYDDWWAVHWSNQNSGKLASGGCAGSPLGGCNGAWQGATCTTEQTFGPSYFPNHMMPKENPYYLDLPYGDTNSQSALSSRCSLIPWAHQIDPAGAHCADSSFSYLKNRWVKITYAGNRNTGAVANGATCYAQIEDVGPGPTNDSTYDVCLQQHGRPPG